MPSTIVIGGGLAGLSAALTLGEAGYEVGLYESRPFPGGRATSYPLTIGGGAPVVIDNSQHILLRCCEKLLDFYARLGVDSLVRFHREFYFLEPGGRVSTLRRASLPSPIHFAPSFLSLRFLGWRDKLALARALLAMRIEQRRTDLDGITMMEWLNSHHQTRRAIDRFWRPVLVSAINEEPERMAATHGFQVFTTAFLGPAGAADMGIPSVPLARLYASEAWKKHPNVRLHLRAPVERVHAADGAVHGVNLRDGKAAADAYISAVPFERIPSLLPFLGMDFSSWRHSPITGIHLWFDRPVTNLPHGALLDRTVDWFFQKPADPPAASYIQVVISASRALLGDGGKEIAALAVRELSEFLPEVGRAKLLRSHVVKEARATFSASPGLEEQRPGPRTAVRNLFLAGDWTRTGWPATMEGAVRSGYRAAEAVRELLG